MSKKKILAICDHPLCASGVATQARFLIEGLAKTGRYSFRVLGAATKHQDYRQASPAPDIIIKPVDGFGDGNTLRQLLVTEKPDALFLFTDPRYFMHVWTMEDEVHQVCPIVYNTIWDNSEVTPDFNKYVYESCDLLHCINYPTYEFVKEWRPDVTYYTPHAVPKELYKPIPRDKVRAAKARVLGQNRQEHFIVLAVSRNAKRKRTSDIAWAFKMFLDELETKHGHRNASLVMHMNPLDTEGPNLYAVIDKLGISDNIVFSQSIINFNEMATLYNMSDVLVNISSAEGFGLPVLEMKMCGKPVIALKTGGLTRQVQDLETGEQFGVALEVENRVMVGNQVVPYICDDYCDATTVAAAYMKMYELGPEGRDALGARAMEHAHRDYDMDRLISSWDMTLMDTIQNWRSRREPWRQVEL